MVFLKKLWVIYKNIYGPLVQFIIFEAIIVVFLKKLWVIYKNHSVMLFKLLLFDVIFEFLFTQ